MLRNPWRMNYVCLALAAHALAAMPARAATLVIDDKLNGASSSFDWQALNGACLTAGDGTGSIPKCVGLPYYTSRNSRLLGGTSGNLPDAVGHGALRLTNGGRDSNGNNQTGAVYSKFTFPSNAGVDITFKTVTYGGNGFKNHAGVSSGADGIAFFLTDGDQVRTVDAQTQLGAFGGSLGYSCANGKAVSDGLGYAYIGLGIDEFGSFSSKSDNTNTGTGPGWNWVTLRGAGNVNWDWLSTAWSRYYPASRLNTTKLRQDAVAKTCSTGKLWDYSRSATKPSDVPLSAYGKLYNYDAIKSVQIDRVNSPIYNQQNENNPTRGRAKPITYNLKITQDGKLSLAYSYNGGNTIPVITDQLITASNGPLPSKFRFGFSSGTGSGSNIHEIMCFKATPFSGASSSAGGNVPAEGQVQAGSQIYLATYHPDNWWGQLTAQTLVLNEQAQTVHINPTPEWDASCTLTGGACQSTGANLQAQSARRLLTSSDGAGVVLEYDSLSTAQQTALGAQADLDVAKKRLDYLKGDRSQERDSQGNGQFRMRNSVLGDIINASPVWVGPPSAPYKTTWKDMLDSNRQMPENQASYANFQSANAGRTHVVYAGSNDGFMHAFRAGANQANQEFDQSHNDGHELLAYMPAQVLSSIHHPSNGTLSYSDTSYSHNAYVDATPGTGDLLVGGQWRTWLVGGLGGGANPQGVLADKTSAAKGAIFALDITDPDRFSTASAHSLVVGEWNSDTIRCESNAGGNNCGQHLGNTYGTPLIRRMHDGNWAAIFGNGQNSQSGESGIFIMTVDQASGNLRFRYLKAGDPIRSGNNFSLRNGITQVTAADLDGDHITDYLYAGDMRGNVWRFDVTSSSASDWSASARRSLLFNANQPITTGLAVSSTTLKGMYRVILNFGTGKVYPQTGTMPVTTDPGDYYIYGLWDSDMTNWNTKSTARYETLPGASTIAASELATKTIADIAYTDASGKVEGLRSVSTNEVCWKGSTDCGSAASSNPHRGWKMKLPGTDEQIIYSPSVQDGFVIFNTTVPPVEQVLSCDQLPASGFTMALLPDQAAPRKSYFKNYDSADGVIAGVGASGVGMVFRVQTRSKTFLVTQTVDGTGMVLEVDPNANTSARRVTWMQRR